MAKFCLGHVRKPKYQCKKIIATAFCWWRSPLPEFHYQKNKLMSFTFSSQQHMIFSSIPALYLMYHSINIRALHGQSLSFPDLRLDDDYRSPCCHQTPANEKHLFGFTEFLPRALTCVTQPAFSFEQIQQATAAEPSTATKIHMSNYVRGILSFRAASWPAEPEIARNSPSKLVKCKHIYAGTEEVSR